MIYVTMLNGKKMLINADLIEFIEETPDTVITMTTNRKLVVTESIADIINRIIEYKSKFKNQN